MSENKDYGLSKDQDPMGAVALGEIIELAGLSDVWNELEVRAEKAEKERDDLARELGSVRKRETFARHVAEERVGNHHAQHFAHEKAQLEQEHESLKEYKRCFGEICAYIDGDGGHAQVGVPEKDLQRVSGRYYALRAELAEREDRICALRGRIFEAHGHLGAALSQSIEEDDQIIVGHMRGAKEILEGALKNASNTE